MIAGLQIASVSGGLLVALNPSESEVADTNGRPSYLKALSPGQSFRTRQHSNGI
jgi:hypothetical protein